MFHGKTKLSFVKKKAVEQRLTNTPPVFINLD